MSEKLPIAVWEGEIMGVRVAVLDDGRRVINADDVEALFAGDRFGDLDFLEFATAFKTWADEGEKP